MVRLVQWSIVSIVSYIRTDLYIDFPKFSLVCYSVLYIRGSRRFPATILLTKNLERTLSVGAKNYFRDNYCITMVLGKIVVSEIPSFEW